MKTVICLLLDRSGSMVGREADVIGGVNTFLAEQKLLPDPADFVANRFDSYGTECFRALGPLALAVPLIDADFVPRGGTPLLDAVGFTIHTLDSNLAVSGADRAIMVIVTDGEENSSREYTSAKIKALIAEREAKNWAFVYLGANVDAFKEANAMGIQAANTAGYKNTKDGTRTAYASASVAVSSMRGSMNNAAPNLGMVDVEVAQK